MTELSAGFVGLGAMGWSMAAHLQRAGYLVAVSNRSPEKAQRFAAEHNLGAAVSAGALADSCNVIILCVTADADVLEVVGEIAKREVPGIVVIDHSTVSSTTAQAALAMLQAVGCDFIDAPVSGGVEGAKNGKLSVMAGSQGDALERVRPLLDCYAARVSRMGNVGAGQNTKAVNQVLVAGIAQGVCEGLALGEALGLDPEVLLPTLLGGAAGCWFLDKRGASMLRSQFGGGFKLSLLHKDLGIVQGLMRAAGTDRSVVEKSLSDYARLMAQGHGDEEISALIRLKRRLA